MSQVQSFSVQDYISKFDGGSKPTLFTIRIKGGSANQAYWEKIAFFGKATTLPASTIGEISVPYMGRVIKAPGDRTYEDWTVTVLNQEGMELRKKFEEWNRQLNDHINNVAAPEGLWGAGGNNGISTNTVEVVQLDRAGKAVRTYTLIAAFPKEVGSVDLAFDTVDTISEFTVTFAYSYFIAR